MSTSPMLSTPRCGPTRTRCTSQMETQPREIMTLLVRVHNRPIAMAKVRFPPIADIHQWPRTTLSATKVATASMSRMSTPVAGVRYMLLNS